MLGLEYSLSCLDRGRYLYYRVPLPLSHCLVVYIQFIFLVAGNSPKLAIAGSLELDEICYGMALSARPILNVIISQTNRVLFTPF